MKVRLLTFVLVVLFCAATASSQGPLLNKTVSSVNATSNVAVNVTLDPGFLLKGTISAEISNVPSAVVAVSTTSSASFSAQINQTAHTYRIVLPAGTYNLDVTFTHIVGQQSASFTFRDSTGPVNVSMDTIHDVTLPVVTTSLVMGTVSNLNALFPSRSLSFNSTSIPGFSSVSSSSALDVSGNYAVQLPSGSFTATLSQSLESLTTFFTSSLNSNLGSFAVTNPLNLAAPNIPTATLSGTVSITGTATIPTGSFLSGTDVSGGAPPQTVSSGTGPLPPTGAYGFTFSTGRTYALNPSIPVLLLPNPAPPGIYSPPDPAPALLTMNTTRNITFPALPGPATGVTISGRVTITGTLTPVANASVTAFGNQLTGAPNTSFAISTTTDGNGNYSIVVPAGTNYTLLFSGQFATSGDFDGDAKADLAIWRSSNGTWFVNESDPHVVLQQWGAVGDIPVRGDFDGDGKTDFAVWRPSTGEWFIIPSSNPSTPIIQQWGTSRDIPVPGDYDGDGITDVTVWRPSNGTWYVLASSTPGAPILKQWGTSGDIPVPGDYDGDGKTDFAVWRTGTWYIIPSSNPSTPTIQQWGTSGDIPVPVDYDRDRKTDIAVWRPSNGVWYIIPSSAPSTFTVTQWGTNGDVPVQKPIGQ